MVSNRNNRSVRRAELLDARIALAQRNSVNSLKNQGYKNEKTTEWIKSLVGQKFVLNLKLNRHKK